MKTKSITIKRNNQVVGNNSMSYSDKHPENPISLRPIHDARKKAGRNGKIHTMFLALRNFSRPAITYEIAHINLLFYR